MVRSTNWVLSVAMGLLLAWDSLDAQAQVFAVDEEPTTAESTEAADSPDAPSDDADEADTTTIRIGEGDASPAMIDPDESQPVDQGESYDSLQPEDEETEVITERFPGGTVKIEREVRQDSSGNYINHGAWDMWDQRGNPVVQGEYQNDQRVGTWIRWYRTAAEAKLFLTMPYQQFSLPFISQATFKKDQLDGTWTIYDGKKQKISQWEFADGRRNGVAIWWYPNGRKMREAQYRDGEMDGQLVEWKADGGVLVQETYQFGRRLGRKTTNHPNGKKKLEGMYLYAKDFEQTPDDWWNCKPQVTIKQGTDEKHGPWTTWYSNGQRQQDGTYEHDLQAGQFTWWHENGQKSLVGKFENGKQDGLWTWWYPNGQKSIRGEYSGGNPTGRWTWWNEDGKVAQSADLTHSEGVVVETPRSPEPLAAPKPLKQSARPLPRR